MKAGDPLFELESTPQKAARDEAAQRLAQARASLEDLKKGKRPSEIEAIEAQLQQARAALELAEKEFSRQEGLVRSGATTVQELDRARATRDQDRQRVAQLEADLKTAQLGSRSDQIAAAEANVRALEAALAKAEWDLSQKRQTAPQAGSGLRHALPRGGMGRRRPAGGRAAAAGEHQGAGVRARDAGRRDPSRATPCGSPWTACPSRSSARSASSRPRRNTRRRSSTAGRAAASWSSWSKRSSIPTSAANLHPGQPVDVEFGSVTYD